MFHGRAPNGLSGETTKCITSRWVRWRSEGCASLHMANASRTRDIGAERLLSDRQSSTVGDLEPGASRIDDEIGTFLSSKKVL